jgi:hypothetical protein
VKLKVRVHPGAPRDEVAGWLGEALKLRVRAAPEKGRANRAVEELLSDRLGVRVKVVGGLASRDKTVEVPGLDAAEVARRLGKAPGEE